MSEKILYEDKLDEDFKCEEQKIESNLVLIKNTLGFLNSLEKDITLSNGMISDFEWKSSCNICKDVSWTIEIIKIAVENLLLQIDNKEKEISWYKKDIKFLKLENSELLDKVYKDQLTWLFNRRFMEKVIDSNIERSENERKYNFLVWMIDLDFFKDVNDTYWHDAWDLVLKTFSSYMLESFKLIENSVENCKRKAWKRNLLFRYWWEEFIVVSSLPKNKFKKFLEKCLKNFSQINHEYEWKTFNVSFSAWISEYIPWKKYDNNSFELIKRADKALYKAKEKWRKMVLIDTDIEPSE